jgi:hypothetical protein
VARRDLAAIRAGYREVRRVMKHGPGYPWRRYIGPTKILKARAIQTQISGDITVCVLTSRRDWFSCLWSLVSFYEFSGLQLPLLIYSDGTLGENHERELAKIFPNARFVSSSAGEALVAKELFCYPNCMRFRRLQPYARKITDLPVLGGSPYVLIFDSDVLFLKRPEELIQYLGPNLSGRFVFERDYQEAYFDTADEIKRTFDVDIASRVNVGIIAADVSNFDYAKIERWLAKEEIAQHPWAEQTLWAMYAGREQTALLGGAYDVTMATHVEPETVAKHYISPIREYLYTEGIPYLERRLTFAAN